jgi:hypothetical protein
MNFEFVRKEAKSLLKLCRSKDPSALSRIRANLPHLAGLPNEAAATEIQLADVQHALAREWGLASWTEFKQLALSKTKPDFSCPGNDGESLPEGFNQWRSCVSYTVRPEIYTPLIAGGEYRIFVRSIQKGASYAELYKRALAIAKGRAEKLRSAEGLVLHSRLVVQGWFRYEAIDVPTAYLTLNVTAHRAADSMPEGLIPPTAEELSGPGGMTPETVPQSAFTPKEIHESYTDPGELGDDQQIILISFGEYVSSLDGIDYAPFVERAEKLAKFHSEFLKGRWTIMRREWFSATTPDIVVVHIFLRRDNPL